MALSEVFPEPSSDLADQPDLTSITRPSNILDPGFDLTLRPMRYPYFYEMYQAAIKTHGQWMKLIFQLTLRIYAAEKWIPLTYTLSKDS